MSNPITVYGIDFTSRPSLKKPITCLECRLIGNVLQVVETGRWKCFEEFEEFERFLTRPPAGPQWIAGIDCPFGMPRKFIENMTWPTRWADYIDQKVEALDRRGWRKTLEDYKRPRRYGDKEHRRDTDIAARSLSPQKLYGTPVGLMFFEGAPRLRKAGVMIPGLQDGCPERLVVEAYPGVVVRNLVGKKVSYKADSKGKQTDCHLRTRKLIIKKLVDGTAEKIYGITVQNLTDPCFANDPTGDRLDALLCSVQAAWAWRSGAPNFGLPTPICPTEGWIADPMPPK